MRCKQLLSNTVIKLYIIFNAKELHTEVTLLMYTFPGKQQNTEFRRIRLILLIA